MTPVRIFVHDSKESIGSQQGYEALLKRFQIVCLVDGEGFNINDFESLVHGGAYTLGPSLHQQPPTTMSQYSHETMRALEVMARDYVAKKNTIVLSQATSAGKRELLDMISLPEKGTSWPSKPTNCASVAEFAWKSSQEDSDENRIAYMDHLNGIINLPSTHALSDAQPIRDLLSVEFLREAEDGRKIRGTTDVVITRSEHKRTIRNNIETLIELKKPHNLKSKDHTPQTVCEHFAASYLNRRHPVVTLLTDLHRSWTFFWFASADGAAALYRLDLEGEHAAMESKFILDSLYNHVDGTLLPISLSDRLPFQAVLREFEDDQKQRIGREQENLDDDDDGGDGFFSNNNESKPSKPRKGPHTGGENNSSGSSKTAHQHNHQGATVGDNSMNMASALSLFAPSSSRDVANELDLLDMMDVDEQYETVRTFAMKHIVPYMRGVQYQ